jgi:hypothetical protein
MAITHFCADSKIVIGQARPGTIEFDVIYANGLSFRAMGMASRVFANGTAGYLATINPSMPVKIFYIGKADLSPDYGDFQAWRGFGEIASSMNC